MIELDVLWKLASGVQVGQALQFASNRLKEAEIDTASLDAQVLLAHLLGQERSWLFAHHEIALSPEQAEQFTDLIMRRLRHEPVAYLIGRKEFYGIDLMVDQRVLIPRPETELLVDEVIHAVESYGAQMVSLADVGTGSGAIALAVAANCVNACIYAIDLSSDALAVAGINIDRLDDRDQITLLQGDLLAPLPAAVDIIVANLPYIASNAYLTLDSTVRDYEPQLALESGTGGLDAIQRLLHQVPCYLKPHGKVFLEIGHDQGLAVQQIARALLPKAKQVYIKKDYLDHDRIVRIEF